MVIERHTQAEIDMIDQILGKLQIQRRWLVDLGANDGVFQSSTRHLFSAGWHALLIEAEKDLYYKLSENTAAFFNCRDACMRVVYLDDELEFFHVPADLDLLHIDIDGQDYWVWKNSQWRPKVVSIEYNSNFEPGKKAAVPFDPDFRWAGDTFYGASAAALHALGRKKGYTLVGQTPFSQLFFVRDDLAAGFTLLDPLEIPMERIHPLTSKEFCEPA